MNKIALIAMILKTAACTLFFVGGVYLLMLSRERLEAFFCNLIAVRDMEVPTASLVFIKIMGVVMIALSLFCVYRFFIYDPDAQFQEALIESAHYFRYGVK